VQQPFKRTLDLALAVPAMVLVFPVIVAVAVAIRLCMGKPVLFRHVRAGKHGMPFTMLKFRTMSDARDADGKLLPDGERMNRLGRFLRSTSLDELPQLWNVLRGEMSLVGPRPLLMEYVPRYTPEQARRLDVMPGITGWTGVNGRNSLHWEQRLALETWYVDHWSLALDVTILWRTFWHVLRSEGINEEGYATSAEFKGTKERAHVPQQ
jgi:sugar transferase EpsL